MSKPNHCNAGHPDESAGGKISVGMRDKLPISNCYILTHDLGKRIESFRDLGLNTPNHDDQFYSDFKEGLEKRIRKIYPDDEIKSLYMNDLTQRIWNESIHKKSSIKNAVIVSTSHDIATPRRGHTLEINRVYDHNGKQFGFGSRPGNPCLDEQIISLAKLVGNSPVVLAEDGVFSGNTILYILDKFKKKNISVSTIVLGFSSRDGIDTVKKVFDGEIITLEGIPHLIDWMPDHDFIPFAPNCGRVLGISFGNEALPVYTYDGVAFAFPYIRPFGDLNKWGSIPEDQVNEFSHYCMQQALELFKKIEDLNGKKSLLIRDLLGTRPSIRIPVCFNSDEFPSLDTRVTEYLLDTYWSLS